MASPNELSEEYRDALLDIVPDLEPVFYGESYIVIDLGLTPSAPPGGWVLHAGAGNYAGG